jgi:EAL domain-containing protein (putative c-di-GMP-specific phosphodiesterase class I)
MGPAAVGRSARQADLALYRAKSDGRNGSRVQPAMEIAITYRRDLARDPTRRSTQCHPRRLPADHRRGYGRAVAMEALARWRHPTIGPIPASTFIAIAEEFGLIHRLGDVVMHQACLAAAAWPPSVRIAVNVSALQVAHGELAAVVREHIERAGLEPGRIELEITESALLADESRVRESLRDIRAMGVQIVLDDFGTGFASLSNLNAFAVDRIKIDRSFIAHLGTHRGSTAIVEASTMIAEAFRVEVTAEGVETEEQYEMLRRLGVHHLQGYLFARPAPREAWDFVDGRAVRRNAVTGPPTAPA